ncbi:hypothetical protein BS78_06G170600 [Paspalum vaginatum]|nr:hypothetical protein BS78_06G170600 [Paspalum vaginatum]
MRTEHTVCCVVRIKTGQRPAVQVWTQSLSYRQQVVRLALTARTAIVDTGVWFMHRCSAFRLTSISDEKFLKRRIRLTRRCFQLHLSCEKTGFLFTLLRSFAVISQTGKDHLHVFYIDP